MSAAIKTRAGDPEADRSAVIALLSRHVNPAYDRRRFDWVYRGNPAGPGRFWVAVDGSTGDLIGTAGALPRRMSIDGTHVTGWALTDFCISDSYRSLGPALRLQRTCLEELAGDGGPLWYDFPGRGMEAVYRRLGVPPCAHVRRLARPLRTYAKLRERLGSRVLARVASLPVDLAIAWATRAPRPSGSVTVAPQRGPLGEEFTDLARRVTPGAGICVWRSAEYLNWRYCENPVQPHELVAARLEGQLVAYVALTHDGNAATLVDLFGETEALRALVLGTVAQLRARGAVGVSAWMGDTHPYAALLRELGFRPRETAPVMAGAASGSPWGRAIRDANWLLTYGDRDT